MGGINTVMTTQTNKTLNFDCTIKRKVFGNTDFKVYGAEADVEKYPFLQLNQYGNITIAGNIHELGEGIKYQVTAVEEMGKYGVTYKVLNIRRDRPRSDMDTRVFLMEILSSSRQVDEIMREYPDIIERVVTGRTDDIDTSKLYNIGEYRMGKIIETITDNFVLIDLVDKFQGTLTLSMIKTLYTKYASVERVVSEIKQEPYKCLCGLNRVGFKTADNIIQDIEQQSKLNIEKGKEPIIDFGYTIKDSKQRNKACIMYLLEENESNGNTCIDIKTLKSQSDNLAPACKHHFVDVVKNDNDIYFNKEAMTVGLKSTMQKELYIAIAIKRALESLNQNEALKWSIDYSKYIKDSGLTEEQGKALEYMCKYNFFILNGFGGSGKSYTSSTVIKMLKDNKKTFLLIAPTGRASKILSEYSKEPASTAHRGLEYQHPEWGYNEKNKLPHDVVIADETSMFDVDLMYRLMQAIDFRRTKLMFIGDSAQLPSVGAGNVLSDMIEGNMIPVATLTKIFRYGVGGVLTVATKIRNQEKFVEDTTKPTIIGEDNGYAYLPCNQEDIPDKVVNLYKKLLNGKTQPEDIMLLSSYNVGDYGTIAINKLLQPVANPNFGSKERIVQGDTVFFINDLVMQCSNNYKAVVLFDGFTGGDFDENLVKKTFVPNGETGRIIKIYEKYVVIKFDTVNVIYKKEQMSSVKLAYCISTHKSQGGSADTVILLTPKAHTYMLNSNILYVGVTRAKKNCFHLGELKTINSALKKKENFNRKTMLRSFYNLLKTNKIN